MIKSFFPLFTPRNICCGYLLESPQHMFLVVLNTVFLNISNYLPYLELRNRSIQIVVITNFVVICISNVDIKKFDHTQVKPPNKPLAEKLGMSLYMAQQGLKLSTVQQPVILSQHSEP